MRVQTTASVGRFDDHAFLDYDWSDDLSLYEIGNFNCPPLYSYGPVARPRDIFHFVLSGKGKLYIKNREYTVEAGQGFLIPHEVKALYTADRNDPWSYFWLHIGGARLAEIWTKAGLSEDNPVFVSDVDSSPMPELYRDISEKRDRELYCISKLFEIMDHVTSTSVNRQLSRPNTQLDFVQRIIHIIQIKYSEPLQVTQIAELCGLNRSYMSRIFKDATGSSIQEYLMDYRMKKANRLLKETGESVQTISNLVGYKDIFTFSKAYKKVFGNSPSIYRAEQKNHKGV